SLASRLGTRLRRRNRKPPCRHQPAPQKTRSRPRQTQIHSYRTLDRLPLPIPPPPHRQTRLQKILALIAPPVAPAPLPAFFPANPQSPSTFLFVPTATCHPEAPKSRRRISTLPPPTPVPPFRTSLRNSASSAPQRYLFLPTATPPIPRNIVCYTPLH